MKLQLLVELDADLFYIFKADGDNDQALILFKSRPDASNPLMQMQMDIYEIELTKT